MAAETEENKFTASVFFLVHSKHDSIWVSKLTISIYTVEYTCKRLWKMSEVKSKAAVHRTLLLFRCQCSRVKLMVWKVQTLLIHRWCDRLLVSLFIRKLIVAIPCHVFVNRNGHLRHQACCLMLGSAAPVKEIRHAIFRFGLHRKRFYLWRVTRNFHYFILCRELSAYDSVGLRDSWWLLYSTSSLLKILS